MRVSGFHALATAFLVFCGAAGCGAPGRVRYEESLARTPEPAIHAVHSERLLELMRGLERLRDERLPQAMDVEAAETRRAEGIAEVAHAMMASARLIPSPPLTSRL